MRLRLIVALMSMVAIVMSNVTLGFVHAAKTAHSSHIAMDDSADVEVDKHRHHENQQISDTSPLNKDANSSNTHHSDGAANSCCAFACAAAIASPLMPDFLPSSILSRMPVHLADSMVTADWPPHDRPPRSREFLAG